MTSVRKTSTPTSRGTRGRALRFLTCGSVDDGKSTLIGRLLHDTKMIYEDQARRGEARQREGRHHRGR
ncbi:MAG: GTP-binding protein [Gemmataceae bacterium]